MGKKRKSWAEKMITPAPYTTVIDKGFAGVPDGATLLISSPGEIDQFVRKELAPGETITVPELRQRLARKHRADATCPLTTSIFLRIVSEVAWDKLQAGAALDEVTPFWRAVDPKSPLAKKLRAGTEWIRERRGAEGG